MSLIIFQIIELVIHNTTGLKMHQKVISLPGNVKQKIKT